MCVRSPLSTVLFCFLSLKEERSPALAVITIIASPVGFGGSMLIPYTVDLFILGQKRIVLSLLPRLCTWILAMKRQRVIFQFIQSEEKLDTAAPPSLPLPRDTSKLSYMGSG